LTRILPSQQIEIGLEKNRNFFSADPLTLEELLDEYMAQPIYYTKNYLPAANKVFYIETI